MISVLLPVKNTREFLQECLDSILQQTEVNWECIMVDDHSTDGSDEILQGYATRDKRFIYLTNQGKGIIEALRTALAHSNGDLITRMDSDDIMSKSKLELLKGAVKNGKDLAVGLVRYFPYDVVKEGYRNYEKWLNDLTSIEDNFSEIYKECVIPSPCWMMRREDLLACDAFNPDVYPEDYDLSFRMRRYGCNVRGVREVIHYWRDHSGRTSRNDDNYADNRFLALKVNYFLEDDYKSQNNLVLWGAGTKGKDIARLLNERDINYNWVCNNPKKIGLDIYGQTLQDSDTLDLHRDSQVIVAVANREEQAEIRQRLKPLSNCEVYFFC